MNEYVTNDDWDSVRRNFEGLKSSVLDLGGQSASLRFGAASLTWPGGSATSDAVDVPHGLPQAAVSVVAMSRDANVNVGGPTGFTDTTFRVQGQTVDGTSPLGSATTDLFWIAIG